MKYVYLALTLATAGCVSNTPPSAYSNSYSPVTYSPVSNSAPRPDAAAAFIAACVNTAQSPNAAINALKAQGFKETGTRRGRLNFESAVATAAVSQDTNNPGQLGQCSVTPKGGDFATSVASVRRLIGSSTVPAVRLPGEEAWILGSTGAIALISRKNGAMTRTQPNVYR